MTQGGPERIDHFVLCECIGQGGMGRVHRARDERLSRDVAIKVLARHRSTDPDATARFEREARLLSRLDHPNLCRVHATGEFDGHPYLVMQLVDGDTLEARIRAASDGLGCVMPSAVPAGGQRAQVPSADEIRLLVALFETVAHAVHHAHQRGLVHRDLKPSNLMIDAQGEPVVLDFGLAQDRDAEVHLTRSLQTLGTPQYMAPEQIDADLGNIDARTDVHALGVTLYEALTLWPAYVGASLHALSDAILAGRPQPLRRRNPAISRDLATVVATAMATEPDRRYRDAASLAEDLRRVRCSEPILARRPGRLRRTQLFVRRNPLVATFLVLLVSSLVFTTLALLDANTSRRGIAASLQQFDRLAIMHRLNQAEDAAARLFPAWPSQTQALRDWLLRHGEPMARERTNLAAAVAELRAKTSTESTRAEWELDPASSEMLLLLLDDTLPRLQHFVEHPHGTLADVRTRLSWSETTTAKTLEHPDWPEASRLAATLPVYGGRALVPQFDLVPLGLDPRSGLLEFLHLPSHQDGAPLPVRDSEGRLPFGEETGIVLVLIPGGAFTMGAQAEDPNAPRFDPRAEPDEVLTSVSLDPYFVSKFELTQAQWERLAHDAPSLYGPRVQSYDKKLKDGRSATFAQPTLRHPVEQVAWWQAQQLLEHQGMTLPTEAQWERACRALTDAVYSTGDDEGSLQAVANMPDQTARVFSEGTFPYFCDWTDGYPATAPVGTFAPNRFGLHDVHGNVYEWCLDAQLDVKRFPVLRDGDGMRREDGATADELLLRCYRGGSFQMPPVEARCANRMRMHQHAAGEQVGLRPARAVR